MKLKPTLAYDYYWKFAYERQNIFFRKLSHISAPFSEDKIFQKYKFTNAYRASDRVSQFLINHVIYSKEQYSEHDILFRILLFKIFNKIDTWLHLEKIFQNISWETYNYTTYNDILTQYKLQNSIYSNAYIMASPKLQSNVKKHSNHLLLIEYMLKDNLLDKILNAKSLKEVYEILLSYPSLGKFLAYQLTIDINYSELCNFSENDFVKAGPGALDGISKCFKNFDQFSPEYIIQYVTEQQKDEFKRLNLNFKNLWGRDLHLIDCQNLFCEISKYTRVALPNLKGVSNRTKIKQKYIQNKEPIKIFYPPKWKINDLIKGIDNENF
jgi:hypothetical protein